MLINHSLITFSLLCVSTCVLRGACNPLCQSDTAAQIRTSIRAFGATGGGEKDDTAALNRAIASLTTGGEIYIPRGRYLFTDLRVPSGITIRCENRDSATLLFGGDGRAIAPRDSGMDNRLTITNCTLRKQGPKGGTAIWMNGVWNSSVTLCHFLNWNVAVDLDGTAFGSYFNTIDRNEFSDNTTAIRMSGGAGQASNSNTVSNNRIGTSQKGVQCASGTCIGNYFFRNDVEGMVGADAVGLDIRGDNNTLLANWVESATAGNQKLTGIRIRGTGNVSINNKYAITASPNGSAMQLDTILGSANTFIEPGTGASSMMQATNSGGEFLFRAVNETNAAGYEASKTNNLTGYRTWDWVVESSGLSVRRMDDSGNAVKDVPFRIGIPSSNSYFAHFVGIGVEPSARLHIQAGDNDGILLTSSLRDKGIAARLITSAQGGRMLLYDKRDRPVIDLSSDGAVLGELTTVQHMRGGSDAPLCRTTLKCGVTGNDLGFDLTISNAVSRLTSGTTIVLQWAKEFESAPRVVCAPTNVAAALKNADLSIFYDKVKSTGRQATFIAEGTMKSNVDYRYNCIAIQ